MIIFWFGAKCLAEYLKLKEEAEGLVRACVRGACVRGACVRGASLRAPLQSRQ
jgi:hypothetical protein